MRMRRLWRGAQRRRHQEGMMENEQPNKVQEVNIIYVVTKPNIEAVKKRPQTSRNKMIKAEPAAGD